MAAWSPPQKNRESSIDRRRRSCRQDMPATEDTRGFGTLIRQFREIEAIKSRLIRAGVLNGDATTEQVEAALRKIVPTDAFGRRQADR